MSRHACSPGRGARRRGVSPWGVLGSALALVAASLGAGTAFAAEETTSGFFERLDVTLVNIEVYVTDRQGNRIRGLTAEDFQVLEDGEPMTITHFYAVEDGRQVEAPADADGPPEPDPQARATDQRLYLIVYVDNFHIHPSNRNRVFRALGEFLGGHLGPDDQVMLATYERRLTVRQPFTGNPALITSALREVERMSGYGLLADSERRRVLRRILEASSPLDVQAEVRSYAESLYQDVTFGLEALGGFVRSLAGLAGRKALLYVSDGFPLVPGEDLYRAAHDRFPATINLGEAREFDLSRRLEELAGLANANRVSLYTLDAAGLRHGLDVSTPDIGSRISPMVESLHVANLQRPLRVLADRTGGIAILNTNTFTPGLERLAEDLSTYYSLAYSPPRSGDGRYRTIEVEADVPGARVRHRAGYRSRDPISRAADGTLAALLFDAESNPLAMQIELGRAEERGDGHFIVPVWLRVPISEVVMVPREGLREARLRVFLTVMDDDGGRAPIEELDFPIQIPEEDWERAREMDYGYEARVLMRSGAHRVAVGLLDEIGGEAAFLVRRVWVGAADGARG